jgi:hypothetical protein
LEERLFERFGRRAMSSSGVGEEDQYRVPAFVVGDAVDYRGASQAGLESIWAPTIIGRAISGTLVLGGTCDAGPEYPVAV